MALIVKAVAFGISFSPLVVSSSARCRILPTDDVWPAQEEWDIFNRSVDGRLIKTIPIAAPCHDPGFDEQRCKAVQTGWTTPELHEANPSSIMEPLFLNNTCSPFTPRESSCPIGNYVEYAVNVSSPEHIAKTIRFVKDRNIRFIVKNTGHDYMGRSTGTGAVSVWMHNLQNITWLPNFKSPIYSGAAVKAYAGVRGIDLVTFASKEGHTVVSGECPTVGFVGGYIQGAGHSALTNLYGLAADQALEFELVTAQGQFLVASPTQNEDLFWALRGGGGGAFAIVWSVTVKAFPDTPVSSGFLNFTSAGIPTEVYWQAIATYQALLPQLTDSKFWTVNYYTKAGVNINPVFAPNQSIGAVRRFYSPLENFLRTHDINYTFSIASYPNYLEAYKSIDSFHFPVANIRLGSRLIPRAVWNDRNTFSAYKDAVRTLIETTDASVAEVPIRPTLEISGYPENAVLPAWRDAQVFVFSSIDFDPATTPFEQTAQIQNIITTQVTPLLRKVAPGSGTYMNEADPNEPNFKQAFYGANYNKLLAIKDKWDPDRILYGSIAVGGDRWHLEGGGRLCRT